MICPSCGRELPAAFPGAKVSCACGYVASVPASTLPPRAAGPYRAASTGPLEDPARETACPYCGNGCPPLVRICPHCDVRLDSVRCTGCFSLQPPGSFVCARCSRALELEPFLDATDAPCPRCTTPLEGAQTADAPDARVHECPRCGGMFVPRDALAEILCRAEIAGPFRDSRFLGRAGIDEIKYLPCPLCHTSMNRVNFGKVSGVIVDVCRKHGTWFDAGELTRVVAFAASGGLEKTRRREQQDKKDEGARVVASKTEFFVGESRYETDDRVEAWRDFLHAILWW